MSPPYRLWVYLDKPLSHFEVYHGKPSKSRKSALQTCSALASDGAGGLGAQFPVDGKVHGEDTGHTSQQLGDRLGGEYAGGPHPDGQDNGKRCVDNGLTQQGEEHRLLGAAQADEHTLACHLQRHGNKQAEVDAQSRDAVLDHIGFVVENPDQKSREQHGNGPEGCSIQHGTCHAEPDGLTYPLIFLRPVVEAGHRLCSVGQALHRHGAHLPQGVDDGHNAHVQVAAVGLEGGVAHHLHQTVRHR